MASRSPQTKRNRSKPAKAKSGPRSREKALSVRNPAPLALTLPERIEKVLMEGDLSPLSTEERISYVKTLCKSLGLNPYTRPFDFIVFTDRDQEDEQDPSNPPRGKMQLYARADCAAQLRKLHKVGTRSFQRRFNGEFYEVECEAYINERAGIRTDSAIGVVWMKKWKGPRGRTKSLVDLTGRERANAMMKAETKAKRRATLSICGLHMLDESELEDLTNMTYDVSETGRVVQVLPAAAPALAEGSLLHDIAVLLARQKRDPNLPFADDIKKHEQELRKYSAQQLQVIWDRMSAATQNSPASAESRLPASATGEKGRPAGTTTPAGPRYSGLGYWFVPESGTYSVDGPEDLKKKHKDILLPLYQPHAQMVVATAEQLGKLIAEFERRKEPFRDLSPREPGVD